MDQYEQQTALHKLAQSAPQFTSRSSLKTSQYYQHSYRNQLHLLVRRTSFFGYKHFRWFRLADNHLLLYSKQTSVEPKAAILFENIIATETRPFLKGFMYCIKLEMLDNRTYWSHCKAQEEKDFLLKAFEKGQKSLARMSIFVNNQTFNPKEYEQYKMEAVLDGDHISRTNRDVPKLENKDTVPSQPNMRIDSLGEENVVTDTANEGLISVNQLKVYSDIYIKPRMVNAKGTTLKDRFSNLKDLTIQCTNINEVSKSDFSNCHSAEGPLTFTKDTYPSQFLPLTPPPVCYSTKETQSGSFFPKISFPISDNNGHRLNTTALPRLYVDTSAIEGDVEEVDAEEVGEEDEDNTVNRDESANTIRTMEFNGVGKKKVYLTFLSKDESFFRKTSLYTEPERRENKTIPQEERASTVKISTARLRGQVIGPRALMSSLGPALVKKDDDQVLEGGTFREEIKKEVVQVQVQEMEYLDKEEEIESGGKSPLCLSLIDPKSDIDLNVNKVDTVEQCVTASHEMIWNYELGKARDCLSLFRGQDLLIELMLAESRMFEIVFSGSVPKIKQVLEHLQDLLNKVNNVNIPPKQHEKYFSNELNKAEICIYRGAMHFFIGNKFQTIRAFAEGWRHYRRLEPLVEKKSFKDALSARSLHRFKFGLGCFNLVFSLIPAGLLKFMRLVGLMNPNKQKGIDLIEACRKEGDIRSNYASIILALYNIEFQGALEQACDIIKESLVTYGKCPIFHWITSIICWKYAQAKDAHLMVKTALWHLKQDSEGAIYLIYELGWYNFINMNWEQSLHIFMKVISQTLPQRFFRNQATDVAALAKSLKLHISIDFTKYQEEPTNAPEERACILPHLPHIAVKIAVCHFYLGQPELAVKWLLSATVIYRNYSNFKSRQEEDFSKLAIKFLKRSSLKMLVYEVIYLMRYLPKMPNYMLCSILEQIEAYHATLAIDISLLEAYLASNNKNDPLIVEYFSALMIKIVNYCLLGDTDIACEIYNKHSKYLSLIPDESAYLVVHIEYWVGRALISENKGEEARTMLKALLKRKKCDFSINTRIRRVLSEIK